MLRERDASWGYRDMNSEVEEEGKKNGLVLRKVFDMPANNHLLHFVKES